MQKAHRKSNRKPGGRSGRKGRGCWMIPSPQVKSLRSSRGEQKHRVWRERNPALVFVFSLHLSIQFSLACTGTLHWKTKWSKNERKMTQKFAHLCLSDSPKRCDPKKDQQQQWRDPLPLRPAFSSHLREIFSSPWRPGQDGKA